jgi:translation elongation factor P/translation initiation factor 5A
MISASQFKKGIVITFEGAHWTVEDYHTHKTAQRRPVLQTKLRHLKTGHVVERAFDEADKFEQPDLQSRTHLLRARWPNPVAPQFLRSAPKRLGEPTQPALQP